jgi:hypothetical protein
MLDCLHAIELQCDCIAVAWEIRPADGEIGDTEGTPETPKEVMPDELLAEIDTIAEMIGPIASDADSPHGHYSAVRNFGPVQYRALAISHSARKREGGE